MHASGTARPRSGKTLVLFALVLPGLLGVLTLVLDGGLLMVGQRQAQNAADAGATAAAWELLQNRAGSATATAQTYVQQYHALASAQVTVNVPPLQGPFAGQARYVEVVVAHPVTTAFSPAVTGQSSYPVRARAVAGYEYVAGQAALAILNPTAVPGLSLSGNATLQVNGSVLVNSTGAGLDENGGSVNLGSPAYAVSVGSSALLQVTGLRVVGGVNDPSRIQNTTSGGAQPLRAGVSPSPDPLRNVATPTAANGVNLTPRGGVSLTSGTTTLQPGVYDYISISNTAVVTFQPGIYVLKATRANALVITGNTVVTGNGVMFYNTGSNYLQNGAGSYDALDGESSPPAADGPTFGNISIDGNTVTLQGLNDPDSPFNGMLIYERRRNPMGITLQGKGATKTILGGTIYAKWSNMQLSGQGTFNNQFYVGSLALGGQGTLVVNSVNQNFGKSPEVFLVE